MPSEGPPVLTPLMLLDIERTNNRLVPIASYRAMICACAPLPTASIAMTAAMPMMMPSIASSERTLLTSSALSAERTVISHISGEIHRRRALVAGAWVMAWPPRRWIRATCRAATWNPSPR